MAAIVFHSVLDVRSAQHIQSFHSVHRVNRFDRAKGEHIVGAARIDEDADPENPAEAAIMDERMAREDQTTSPHTTLDRDDPTPTDV